MRTRINVSFSSTQINRGDNCIKLITLPTKYEGAELIIDWWNTPNIFRLTYELVAKPISVLQLWCWDYQAVYECKQNSPGDGRLIKWGRITWHHEKRSNGLASTNSIYLAIIFNSCWKKLEKCIKLRLF